MLISFSWWQSRGISQVTLDRTLYKNKKNIKKQSTPHVCVCCMMRVSVYPESACNMFVYMYCIVNIREVYCKSKKKNSKKLHASISEDEMVSFVVYALLCYLWVLFAASNTILIKMWRLDFIRPLREYINMEKQIYQHVYSAVLYEILDYHPWKYTSKKLYANTFKCY